MMIWRIDGVAGRWGAIVALALTGMLSFPGIAVSGITNQACPRGSVTIEAGAPIQAAVDAAGDGAVFCLKNGIHRAQAIRPRSGQRFVGEGRTILNGSRLLTGFRRDGRYWVADSQLFARPAHGECLPAAPMCNRPEALFVDDRPLTRAQSLQALGGGKFYIDYTGGKIYVGDDPTSRTVEVTVAVFAFESAAKNVSIDNIVVEKFANTAQKGAIHSPEGSGWTVENCEVRLNSGAGISVGTGSQARNCDVHHNGQIGIVGYGTGILVEDNHVWSNNIYGFDGTWEAGGVKIGLSDGVVFRRNRVHDNDGPGLWCDIDCRNVVYEENVVERNRDIGIFHEISFKAVIRNNVVRHNGLGNRGWFWQSDIALSASQDVEVTGNKLTVAPGRCGIVLIDQGRRDNGKRYKTRNNTVHANEMTFEAEACAGGASDTKPGNENYAIISEGDNRFDGNTYRVGRSDKRARFAWGHVVTDWDGFRRNGQERNGHLVPF